MDHCFVHMESFNLILSRFTAVWLAMGCATKAPDPTPSTPSETATEHPIAPSFAPWNLHATGVGELIPGSVIPASVYAREGKDFNELWTEPMRGLKQMEEYVQGFRDQEGYPTVQFSELDVVARLTHDHTLLGIWVGPTVRTEQGTGVGSTLAELEAAHGIIHQQNIPEPYHCAVAVYELQHVSFLFQDHCNQLQPDTPSTAVYVGGTEDPQMQ